MSRRTLAAVMAGALAVAAFATGCERDEPIVDAGPGTGDAAVADPSTRSLRPRGCVANGWPPVAGVWAARFETVSSIRGGGLAAQPEGVTRYAVVELCQDGLAVQATWLACEPVISPVLDNTGTCAAQVPGPNLWAALPTVVGDGALDLSGPAPVLRLVWGETWGLAEGARLPAEPSGITPVESDAVVDQDGDGHPGVTLRGDGPVPTVSWAARITGATFQLQVGPEALILQGVTASETAQTILGGPATRALRGRRRTGAAGEALFLRLNSPSGALPIDANRDGAISCAELGVLVGSPLPLPKAGACTP